MSSQNKPYRVGIIGYGQMAANHVRHMIANPRYELVAVCDLSEKSLALASERYPGVATYTDMDTMFKAEKLDLIGAFTRGEHRPPVIRKALEYGADITAEKPLAVTPEEEDALVEEIEASGRMCTMNHFHRNAWFNQWARDFIRSGEIGKLAIVRFCHLFPGRPPGDGEAEADGPVFRACGMHYVDLARWYAESEYANWDARGVRMWSENPDTPWYATAHGHFENGILFEISNTYGYAMASKHKLDHSYIDLIGTLGTVRIDYDAWGDVQYRAHGINETVWETRPYISKYFDVYYERVAEALESRDYGDIATPRDSALAANVSAAMNRRAVENGVPAIGKASDVDTILELRERNQAQPYTGTPEAAERVRRFREANHLGG